MIVFGIARQYKSGQDTDTRHMGTRSTLDPLPALEVVVVPQEQAELVEETCPLHAFELRTY